MQDVRSVSQSLRYDIIKTLTKKAQGIFSWVELSIETLSNSKRIAVEKDVRSELGRLPAKLHEQYNMIYEQILEAKLSTASIARKAFSWMLAAQRPLSVTEMLGAVNLDDDGFSHGDLDVSGLLDICRNLLTVTCMANSGNSSNTEVIQMAHFSVREFLEQLPDFSSDHIHTLVVSRLLHDQDQYPHDHFAPQIHAEKCLQDYSIYLFEHAERSLLRNPECDLAERMKAFLFDSKYNSAETIFRVVPSLSYFI